MEKSQQNWWKEVIIYQIYPRSFKDSNGDGIGDIQGIISQLDYLKSLGVDVIWICPIYQSPNDDNGYDISNYRDIHPDFGSMEDFDELLNKVHARGMKLIMDVVLNHSSDEHPWFQESKSSKDNPYRDHYFWRPGKNGGPPNNWRAFFGGSAWELDEETNEYYLHLFTKKQPDLNWENPVVRHKLYDMLRYWLDKGIDGFRMDVIPLISKRLAFEDSQYPEFNDEVEHVFSNGPKVHEYLNEMYHQVLKDYDIFTVGEGPGINQEVGLKYVGHDRNELNMIFHLDHMFLGHGPKGKFDPVPYGWKDVKRIINEWDDAMGTSGWISVFLDNHDFPRMVSRFGNDQEYRVESAKLLCMMIFSLRGTPCIYQGSEIGMTNVAFPDISSYRDVETLNFYKELEYLELTESEYLQLVHQNGRDNVRTPFQWNGNEHGGFTNGKPWIDVNPNYLVINQESEEKSKDSILSFYRNMIQHRKNNPILIYGDYNEIDSPSQNTFLYRRRYHEDEIVVVLNHSNSQENLTLNLENFKIEIQNVQNEQQDILLPWEARLYRKLK